MNSDFAAGRLDGISGYEREAGASDDYVRGYAAGCAALAVLGFGNVKHWLAAMAAAKRAMVERLAEAQNWRCCYCGSAMRAGWLADDPALPVATVEHIVPRSAGGGDGSDNLAVACGPCNAARGSTPLEKWLARGFGGAERGAGGAVRGMPGDAAHGVARNAARAVAHGALA